MPINTLIIAVLYALLSALGLASMGLFAKVAQQTVPYEVVVFFRFVISLIIVLAMVLNDNQCQLRTQRLPLHLLRDIFGFLALATMIYASHYISIVEIIMLNTTYPLFIPLIVMLYYKDKLSTRLLLGIGIGFIGVVCVLQPSNHHLNHVAALIALASGLFTALAIVLTRALNRTDSNKTIGFYLFLFGTLASALMVGTNWSLPPKAAWLLLLGVGISGVIYQQALAAAVQRISSQYIAPIMYSSVIFSAIFEWYWWQELPNQLTVLGFALIFVGVLLSLQRARHTG